MNAEDENDIGLILTGGGARGAYQIGVLKAISELSTSEKVAFSIISGVSVGALNAVGLASHFSDFSESTHCLERFWTALRTDRVFDIRFRKIAMSGLRMVLSEFMPNLFRNTPLSLLDTTPLRASLLESIDLQSITQSIHDCDLKALSVTCSGYTSGHATTFFQSAPRIKNWHRVRRDGIQRKLTFDHVMASAALPFLFPPVKIEGEYYGDGALRFTSPLAPAIHLDARRLLIIGTRDYLETTPISTPRKIKPPTLGDLAGYALDTLFHDSLDADIERLESVNKTLDLVPTAQRKSLSLQKIETLTINPSQDLQDIALAHAHEMPRAMKWVLRRKKAAQNAGRLESYLLFEPGYINALIALGYKDALAKAPEIQTFLSATQEKNQKAA